MGDQLVDHVRAEVKTGVEKAGKKWKDSKWDEFVRGAVNWLLESGEDSDDVAEAAVGLLVYGATTEKKLQAVADNKKEFAERLTVKGVPDAICDLLFDKYVAGNNSAGNKRDSRRAGYGSSSDISTVLLKRGAASGVGKTWSQIDRTEQANNVYTFANEVLQSQRNVIWIRPSYSDMYNCLWKVATMKPLLDTITYRPVAVTGTSGIGKSFFGVYAIFRAVREKGITVVYNNNNNGYYVIAPNEETMHNFAEGDPRKTLLKLRESDEFRNMSIGNDLMDGEDDEARKTNSMWWGKINTDLAGSSSFLDQLTDSVTTWTFVDLQDGKVAEDRPRLVVLVSDDDSTYQKRFKHHFGIVLYMSAWLREEAHEMRSQIRSNLTEAQLNARYDVVGGVVRSLFAKDEVWESIETGVLSAVNSLEPNKLSSTLVPGSNPKITSMLVHQYSVAPFTEKQLTVVYASEAVRTAIYKRFLFEKEFQLSMWLKYTKGVMGNAERGPQFEWFTHVVLGKIDQALPAHIATLDAKGRGKEEEVEVRPFATEVARFGKIGDITVNELKVGCYLQPKSETYTAIDSACVSKGVPWEPAGENNVAPTLLLFQITTAGKHSTIGHALLEVIDHVHKLGAINTANPDMNFNKNMHAVYLVFIVEKLFAKAEPYLTTEKKKLQKPSADLQRIKQVCLRIT